ncbi:hypothetical protein CEXT_584641 [Caerostris extrusa]|uniref:Uncharacterized protein n=1 Tax=Caerostris extrusa TaxID=172846 RepID=A0AAV4U760_CAEEX|nr:hypothetical protein CEXT_584641 [Caerostris extrusa]
MDECWLVIVLLPATGNIRKNQLHVRKHMMIGLDDGSLSGPWCIGELFVAEISTGSYLLSNRRHSPRQIMEQNLVSARVSRMTSSGLRMRIMRLREKERFFVVNREIVFWPGDEWTSAGYLLCFFMPLEISEGINCM